MSNTFYHVLGTVLMVWLAYVLIPTLVVRYMKPHNYIAYTTVWGICVNEEARRFLSEREFKALVLHERGHMRGKHAWKNMVRTAFFIPTHREVFERYEYEADDFVVRCGYGRDMAAVLRKISVNPFDMARAHRLERLAAKQPGDAT